MEVDYTFYMLRLIIVLLIVPRSRSLTVTSSYYSMCNEYASVPVSQCWANEFIPRRKAL